MRSILYPIALAALLAASAMSPCAVYAKSLPSFEKVALSLGVGKSDNLGHYFLPASVQNETGQRLDIVVISCGVYQDGSLVGTATGNMSNIAPGQTAVTTIYMTYVRDADVSCRVEHADVY